MKTGNRLRAAGLLFIATFLFIIPGSGQNVQMNQQKFARLLRIVDSYYVDSTNIDKLTEKAIVSLLGELDPHSIYISKEEVKKMNEPLKGSFSGIGISFNIFKDTLLVTATIPGGPSEKLGLMAGDRIVNVDGKDIGGIGLKTTDVFDLLRGEKGTKVSIKILRRNQDELLDFTIIRDKIPIHSLDASYMIDEATGYIKLNRFSATTTDEFREALADLKKENLQNLVLDLRGNGGGYLKAAIEISDEFLSSNKLIVYTSGINQAKREFKASPRGSFENGKLVVLVDEGSASASEIVTGAVQDWDRGIVIGRRSFGKGLVQQPFQLTDGAEVRLTTAHYYTPSGRCIQKPYEGVEDYRGDFQERLSHGEMFSADSIEFDESQKYTTLANKRTVFGGGGIMPDIFVPMDTSSYYKYFNKLRRNNIINSYSIEFVDNNRASLDKKYKSFEKYNANFEITDEMIDEIVSNGEKESIEKDEESLSLTLGMMKKELKALIARNLFTMNQFYQIYFEDDEAILKAVEVFKNKDEYVGLLVEHKDYIK